MCEKIQNKYKKGSYILGNTVFIECLEEAKDVHLSVFIVCFETQCQTNNILGPTIYVLLIEPHKKAVRKMEQIT